MSIHDNRDIVIYQPSIRTAILTARALERFAGHAEVYIIGGGEVYAAALPYVDHIYLTRVLTDTPGDVRMPEGWLNAFCCDYSLHQTIHPEGEPDYSFEGYERRIPVEPLVE
jgi:dihydrofolate reductase